MNATAVNPAQLLMPTLNKENGKISKGILKHEFSKELRRQDLQLENDSNSELSTASLHKEPADDADPSPALLKGAGSNSNGTKTSTAAELQEAEKKTTAVKQTSSLTKSTGKSTEKAKDDLVFTDPALLGQILAQLNVSAETRQACKSAEDSQGRVSISALLNALDKQALDGGALPDGTVSGQQVRQLLVSLAQAIGGSAAQKQMTPATLADSYSRLEFRQLMEQISKKFADHCATAASTVAGAAAAQTGTLTSKMDSGTSTSDLTGLTSTVAKGLKTTDAPRLVNSVLPNFVKDKSSSDDDKKSDSGTSSITSKTVSIASKTVQQSDSLSAAQQPTWAQDLAKRLDEMARQGGGTQVVALDPESLGKVSLTVDPGTSPATATIASDNQAVKTQLLESLPLIRQELQNRSFVLGEIQVGTDNSESTLSASVPVVESVSVEQPDTTHDALLALQNAFTNKKPNTEAREKSSSNVFSADAAKSAVTEDSDPTNAATIVKTVSGGESSKLGKLGESLAGKMTSDSQVLEKNANEVHEPADLGRAVTKLAASGEPGQTSSQTKNSFSEPGNGEDPFNQQHSNGAAAIHSVAMDTDQVQSTSAPFQTEFARQVSTGSAQQNTLSLQSSSWPQDLAQRMQDLGTRNGSHQLTLDLQPEGLGKLTLHIGTKDQEVTASLSTENQHVKDLLMRNAPSLREHLESNGFTLSNFSVDVRQGNNGSFAQTRQEVRQQSKGQASARDQQPKERIAKAASVYRRNTGDQLISVFA